MNRKRYTFVVFFGILCSTMLGQDSRVVVAVPVFESAKEIKSEYSKAITAKVTEILVGSNRVRVAERMTSGAEKEIDAQKGEGFMDSDELSRQNVFVGASCVLSGFVTSVDVKEVLNSNYTVSGYKADITLQLNVVDTETKISKISRDFKSYPTEKSFSIDEAIIKAVKTLEGDVSGFFMTAFPVEGVVVKLLPSGNYLVNIGNRDGLKVGNKLAAGYTEIVDKKSYFIPMGELKVIALRGDDACECTGGKGKKVIAERALRNEKIRIIKQ